MMAKTKPGHPAPPKAPNPPPTSKTTAPKAPPKATAPPGNKPEQPPVAAPGPKPAPKKTPAMNQTQQNAFDLMMSTLQSWGLGSLSADLKKMIVGGDTDQAELALALSQTKAYKQRFAANAARVKAGLPELRPAEYIGLEEQYKNILQQYGIPKGFYDTQAETDAWIGGDVSPAEMQGRVQAASDLIYNSPPEAMAAWNQFYGGGTGGAIAAILDPKTAAPIVQKEVLAAQIGGAALSQKGLTTSRDNAERFASEGVTLDQARKAYSDIAQRMPTDHAVGARFGTSFGQSDEENVMFDQSGAAKTKQDTLYAEEASLFQGHGGATIASANQGSNY